MYHYRTKVKFESEDLLNEQDEFVPEYTAYLSCTGTDIEIGDVEIEHIEDENGAEIPIKKFSVNTIIYILDRAYSNDWDKMEPDYD